ncbi:MAG: hypothetical protein B6D63_03430 [Candidatus Latescibacteria bacterium 4484_7]|nr:MAG: hypothetical protein B6D63_03430 [Candidatus Latescibacteria bacterium 4484_7]
MWRNVISEFIYDLKNQKTRVLLTVISIVWGTISVILLLAFGFGMEKRLMQGALNYSDRVVHVYSGETSVVYQGLPIGRSIRFHSEDIDLLRRHVPLVGMISPSYGRGGMRVRYGDVVTTTYGEGVAPDFGFMRHMFPAEGGRFINGADLRGRRRVAFLGDEIAHDLFGGDDPIGKTIMIDNIPYKVIGVMIPKIQTSMSNGPDSRRVIIPYTTFVTVYGRRTLGNILIRPADMSRSKELISEVRVTLGRKYRFDPEDRYAIRVWDDLEDMEIARKIMLGLNIFFGVVGSLTLIVAGVGVANIMFVVVKERTREIGIKRAVGARPVHILMQFIGESLFLTGGGGLLGIAVSIGIISLIHMIPSDEGVLKFMGHPIFSEPVAYVTVAILVAIALLAGFFPARQAASIEPIEALRYE